MLKIISSQLPLLKMCSVVLLRLNPTNNSEYKLIVRIVPAILLCIFNPGVRQRKRSQSRPESERVMRMYPFLLIRVVRLNLIDQVILQHIGSEIAKYLYFCPDSWACIPIKREVYPTNVKITSALFCRSSLTSVSSRTAQMNRNGKHGRISL